MKTTKRFEEAITKLYKAFHEGTLDAMDCEHCAVGNMCDNSKKWGIYSQTEVTTLEELKTGYSKIELINDNVAVAKYVGHETYKLGTDTINTETSHLT